MEIRQLRYFIEICRLKSFSKAAEECYISSQGISMSMMRLENELGYRLFDRTSKGVELTAQAEFLLPRAKSIVSLVDECMNYQEITSGSGYTLEVGFSRGTIEEFAGDVISGFGSQNPNITLAIRELSDFECDDAVLNGEVELGVTVGPLPKDTFDSELLFSSRHAIIVNKDHPLAGKKSITVNELKGVPICVLKGETRTYPCLREACQSWGFNPEVSLFADNILLVFYIAESGGVGISVLPLFDRLARPNLVALPLEDPIFEWNIYVIKKRGGILSAPAQRFWDELIRHRDQLQQYNR